MSAAPLPKPEPDLPAEQPSADAEGWALLEALRRRLDDQGAQGRKTQHQVTQLADSITQRGLRAGDLIFATRDGTPISRNTFRTRVWLPAPRLPWETPRKAPKA